MEGAARQSERQLGMFLCMWLAHTKQAPVDLKGWPSEFRNDGIHAGHLPSTPEVMEYGDRVLSFINEHLDIMRSNAQGALQRRAMKSPRSKTG